MTELQNELLQGSCSDCFQPLHSLPEVGPDEDSEYLEIEHRVNRFQQYKEDTKPVVDHLRSIRRDHEASKVSGCGNYLVFREYLNHDRTGLIAGYFCQKNRLCKSCSVRRAAKQTRILTTKVLNRSLEKRYRAYLVTFTVRNDVSLKEAYGKLSKALSGRRSGRHGIMWKRTRYLEYSKRGCRPGTLEKWYTEAVKADGIFGCVEIKKGRGSGLWHPHMHQIWLVPDDTPAPDEQKLSQELLQATGDSHIVDVREFSFSVHDRWDPESVAHDLVEVCTYVLKFSSMVPKDLVRAADKLRGKHLMKCWGNLRFTKEETKNMEDPYDEELDGPYLDHVFRFVDGRYLPDAS